MIPQITIGAARQVTIVRQPSRTHKYSETQIAGFVDGLDAMEQAVYHRLMTERYAYVIYDDNYGTELEQYKKHGIGYLRATIENTLRDSLLQDDRITGVHVTSIEQQGIDSALVLFDVYTNIGTISTGVSVNV